MSHQTILHGPERRRRWDEDERRRILMAAFAPGAVVAEVARRNAISTSLIYQWRRDALSIDRTVAFAPAVIIDDEPKLTGMPMTEMAAITIELTGGTRVSIAASAPAALLTAALKALRS